MRERLLPVLLFACGLLGCYRPSYIGPYSCDPSHGDADCPESFRCQDHLCLAPGSAILDMKPAEGCIGEGTLLAMAHGARAWACSGDFSMGAYGALCSPPGTHVCGQEPGDDGLLLLLDCDQLSGFYLAQQNIVMMQNGSSYDVRCDSGPDGNGSGILGCGTGAGSIAFQPECHSLHQALHCPTGGEWSCSPQMGLRDVTHTGLGGGTLCCSSALR